MCIRLIGGTGFQMQAGVGGLIAGKNLNGDAVRADAEQRIKRRFLLGGFAVFGGQEGFLRVPHRLIGAFALFQQISQIIRSVLRLMAKIAAQHLA